MIVSPVPTLRSRNEDSDLHAQANLAVIRTYLHEQFEGCEMTERSEGYVSHRFALGELGQRYKLAVASSRLSDRDYTAAKMWQALLRDKVAARMSDKQGEHFFWGWG